MKPRVLILHAPGTNRDGDLAHAFARLGAEVTVLPMSHLRQQPRRVLDYGLLALPGGFSYSDALGAGKLWALDLQATLGEVLQRFVESGRPVLGICNGFQALVKMGLLPGGDVPATLTHNASGRFECRWVTLAPNLENPSPWLEGLDLVDCPVAHGEGRLLFGSPQGWADPDCLVPTQIAFRYVHPDGRPAQGAYPVNPNGSPGDVAGLTNAAGNVLGLMPHPEDHIHPYQHPAWPHGVAGRLGLPLLRNGLRMV